MSQICMDEGLGLPHRKSPLAKRRAIRMKSYVPDLGGIPRGTQRRRRPLGPGLWSHGQAARENLTVKIRAASVLVLVWLMVAGCETVENTARSPLFDQALMMNGHYNLVYPDEK